MYGATGDEGWVCRRSLARFGDTSEVACEGTMRCLGCNRCTGWLVSWLGVQKPCKWSEEAMGPYRMREKKKQAWRVTGEKDRPVGLGQRAVGLEAMQERPWGQLGLEQIDIGPRCIA